MDLPGLHESGLLAILRAADPAPLPGVIAALEQAGVRFVEVTMNTPGAAGVIGQAVRTHPGLAIGAGTVLDAATARTALDAGARFIVSPNVSVEVIDLCRSAGIPVIPGAFTATEIVAAWTAGAAMVKLFPASIGGPALVSALTGPLRHIPLLAVGGVTAENAAAYIKAGAAAVAIGAGVITTQLVAQRDYGGITVRVRAVLDSICGARAV